MLVIRRYRHSDYISSVDFHQVEATLTIGSLPLMLKRRFIELEGNGRIRSVSWWATTYWKDIRCSLRHVQFVPYVDSYFPHPCWTQCSHAVMGSFCITTLIYHGTYGTVTTCSKSGWKQCLCADELRSDPLWSAPLPTTIPPGILANHYEPINLPLFNTAMDRRKCNPILTSLAKGFVN